jgi:ABC-type enterochelin transport system substrate-binding protein
MTDKLKKYMQQLAEIHKEEEAVNKEYAEIEAKLKEVGQKRLNILIRKEKVRQILREM